MNDNKADSTIEIKSAQAEEPRETQDASAERPEGDMEKPLDKMTKQELIERIKEVEKQTEANHDLYLRAHAEMENLKKRNKREKEDWVKYANETLIKEILPVMDNLEKAISHSENENALNELGKGVELTLKGLKDTLIKSGLEEVKALGEPFDPNFHEAVSEQEDEKAEAGIILHELQKGYLLNKRLIRPTMVVVSKGKPAH